MARWRGLNCVAMVDYIATNFRSALDSAAAGVRRRSGAALFAWHQLLDKPRFSKASDSQMGSLLGPEFSMPENRGISRRTAPHPTNVLLMSTGFFH